MLQLRQRRSGNHLRCLACALQGAQEGQLTADPQGLRQPAPDDIAYPVESEPLPEGKRPKERRARQNVIFEFGFFVGKLGRSQVCCLYKSGVVLPSDLNGLIYKEIGDSIEGQAYSIIKELKAAGYKIKV